MKAVIFLLAASTFSLPAAHPSPLELYTEGHYEEAIAAGMSSNTAAGYAVAARAELAREQTMATPCMECLERAANEARKAIAADPRLPESHIYLAAALGYEARIIGMLEARLKNFPDLAKGQIDAAMAADPKDCWAWAALGGWNIEVVHGGGALGRLLYGASVHTGIEDFHKAIALDPHNLVLKYEFALVLSAYDRDRYRDEISGALAGAITDKPRTAYEAFAQSRARDLLAALAQDDSDAFDKLVRRYQGYPDS